MTTCCAASGCQTGSPLDRCQAGAHDSISTEAHATRTIVVDKLSPAEKLELIGDLWDSLDAEDVTLTPAQIEEIDRRLESAEVEPGIPWDEVEARLRQRLC